LVLKGLDDASCDIVDVEVKGTLDGIAEALLLSTEGQLVVQIDYDVAVSQFRSLDNIAQRFTPFEVAPVAASSIQPAVS